jgi:hypothetical protein
MLRVNFASLCLSGLEFEIFLNYEATKVHREVASCKMDNSYS